ncbi:MAG: OmpA family protein [Betaproteobacteria bacterium]|nr:OmpA family protein [Betaproteobacteria bacterium]
MLQTPYRQIRSDQYNSTQQYLAEENNLNKIIGKAALIAILGYAASAAAQTAGNDGHLYDARGNPVMSGSGLCWKTTRWTPAMATKECDPDLVKKEAAPVAAPMPKPAAVAAAPAPAPAAAKIITLAAVSLFDFGKAVLKPAAKTEIDEKIVDKLAGLGKIKLIIVGGHTDRLGSAAYNQKLSEKRAEAVKAYMVAKGLDGNIIETFGFGKTQPAQGVAKCDDKLPRKKLIACLEPHRRVTIEIQALPK